MPPVAKKTIARMCMLILRQAAVESSDTTWSAALRYGAWLIGEEFKCQDPKSQLTGQSQSQTPTTSSPEQPSLTTPLPSEFVKRKATARLKQLRKYSETSGSKAKKS